MSDSGCTRADARDGKSPAPVDAAEPTCPPPRAHRAGPQSRSGGAPDVADVLAQRPAPRRPRRIRRTSRPPSTGDTDDTAQPSAGCKAGVRSRERSTNTVKHPLRLGADRDGPAGRRPRGGVRPASRTRRRAGDGLGGGLRTHAPTPPRFPPLQGTRREAQRLFGQSARRDARTGGGDGVGTHTGRRSRPPRGGSCPTLGRLSLHRRTGAARRSLHSADLHGCPERRRARLAGAVAGHA